MADNIPVTPGIGSVIAADDVSGVLHQRVKVTIGSDGISDGDISSANPMPVQLPAAQLTTLTPPPNLTTAALPSSNRLSDGSAFYDARQTRVLTATDVVTVNNPTSVAGLNLEVTQSAISAKLPALLGARTISQSMGVNIASDQIVPISNPIEIASSGTITSVANAAASFSVLAANSNRKGFIIHNDSATVVFVAFSASASAAAFTVRLTSQSSYFSTTLPVYRGVISAIANAANGSLRITELT